ncbi:MAG: alpha/beta hydrolase domain-containing protein, partial [Rhodospirillales bacterium]
LMDFGPNELKGILEREPPEVISEAAYKVLVPAVDEDGNEVAGVRCPMVQAPLGTYTGWNVRKRGIGGGAMHEFSGSYIPLPETPEIRSATGDPRQSILNRYKDVNGYIDAIETAARSLVEAGFMLEEDVTRCIARAKNWSTPLHDIKGL